LIIRHRDALRRDPAALESLIRDPSIIRLVHQMLCRSIEAGASDLHVEPTGDALRVRARIDGSMRVRHTLPPTAAGTILARVKAMAALPVQPRAPPRPAPIGDGLASGARRHLRWRLAP